MFKERIEKAKVLVEALPYIKKFQSKTLVIKYGGAAMVDERLRQLFAQDIVLLKYVGMHPVIVHGGGKDVSKWMERVGKEPRFVEGLRYTDEETLEIGEMVLCGKLNKAIVSLLNQQGGRAVGLSGKDADIFIAKQIKSKSGQDLGFVGDIERTDPSLIKLLCDQGYIPVVSSIAPDGQGGGLNLNADYAASGLANALNALKLIYLTDVMGLMLGGELVGQLSLSQARELLGHAEIGGGMIPKIECAVRALEQSVESVHIINGSIEHAVLLELFTDVGIGSMISRE